MTGAVGVFFGRGIKSLRVHNAADHAVDERRATRLRRFHCADTQRMLGHVRLELSLRNPASAHRALPRERFAAAFHGVQIAAELVADVSRRRTFAVLHKSPSLKESAFNHPRIDSEMPRPLTDGHRYTVPSDTVIAAFIIRLL